MNRGIFLILALAIAAIGNATEAAWTDLSKHEIRLIDHGGVKLECLDWGGHGDAILFLAGLGNSGHAYDHFAIGFLEHFRVVALTRRGAGKSDKPEQGYDIDTLVEDIRCCLDALAIRRVILVGHSFGALEAAKFAQAYPARVIKVVYLDGAYRPSPEKRALMDQVRALMPSPSQAEASTEAGQLDWLRKYVSGWNEASEVDFHNMQVPIPPTVFPALMRTAAETPPGFDQVTAPSLAIFADDQFEHIKTFLSGPNKVAGGQTLNELGAFHHRAAEWFRSKVRNGHAVELADTGHNCFDQREAEVRQLLVDFLRAQ